MDTCADCQFLGGQNNKIEGEAKGEVDISWCTLDLSINRTELHISLYGAYRGSQSNNWQPVIDVHDDCPINGVFETKIYDCSECPNCTQNGNKFFKYSICIPTKKCVGDYKESIPKWCPLEDVE